MPRYGICIDLSRCIGCHGCVVACKNWNRIDAGEKGRIQVADMTTGNYPDVSRWIFPILCMHCEHPPCVSVCRFGATFKREDGIVVNDPKKCVGCELCTFACPYGVRYIKKESRVADSCDLCSDRIDSGLPPYCVESCPTDALMFGDLEDPDSEVGRFIETENAKPLQKKFMTKPRVYYANMEEDLSAADIRDIPRFRGRC